MKDQLIPKKKIETFLHAIVYDFKTLVDVIRCLMAKKDLLFENEHVPIPVSLADTLNREPAHISSKDPGELIRNFWVALARRDVAIREDMQCCIPEDLAFFCQSSSKS